MDRRTALKLLLSGVAGSVIDTDQLLWTPARNRIYVPHPAQIAFFNQTEPLSLYGVPYHMSNASAGTWLGIVRSTTPWDWKGILDRVLIDPKKGLYVIDAQSVGNNVESRETDGIGREVSPKNTGMPSKSNGNA